VRDIDAFEFSKALHDLYDFFWHDFCDVYLETAKLQAADDATKTSTKHMLVFILRESLKLLHPFVPFVTEEIYQRFPFPEKKVFLMVETLV